MTGQKIVRVIIITKEYVGMLTFNINLNITNRNFILSIKQMINKKLDNAKKL